MVQPPPPQQAAQAARWHLRLLGGVELDDGRQTLTKLPSRAVTALLARLAMAPQRQHPREELIELLWPGVAIAAGRNRLRQALSTLRSLLEPPGQGMAAPVLAADRMSLRLVAGGVHCDVVAFERLVAQRGDADALGWYRGELLPGFYDDWVVEERRRLEALAEQARQRAQDADRDRRGSGPIPARRSGPAPAERPRPLLPQYLTRLVGAERHCAALAESARAHRLVTVFGPGGSGKTRLAVETATRLQAAADGPGFDTVAFVPLVGCTDIDEMINAVLLALRQQERAADPTQQLARLLSGRRALLVLDNFEQLVEGACSVLARLLEATDELHLIVTSRRVLGLDGEVLMALPPLALPDPDARGDDAAANPAVALFADRARAARSDFRLSAQQMPAVVELVRSLEGMPLAIELAAARVRSLSPHMLAGLLRDAAQAPSVAGLELLSRSGPRGGSDARHASMLRVVDWSWQLLPHESRRLLAALSLCRGGFTLAAACALGTGGRAQTMQAIDSLSAHSLLRLDAGAERWVLYELVREHAMLQQTPAQAAATRARLRRWLTAWARALPSNPSLPEVRAELGNIGVAFATAVEDGAHGEAADLALALQASFSDMALPPGVLQPLSRVAEALPDPTQRALMHTLLTRAWHRAGDIEATARHFEAAWRDLPADGAARAQVLARLAHVRWRTYRDPGVQAWLSEALTLAQASGQRSLEASALSTLGAIARTRDAEGAIALQRRALAIWTQAGDEAGQSTGLYNLSLALHRASKHRPEALELVDRMIDAARDAEDWGQLANGCNQRGEILSGMRQWSAAAQAYRESVSVSWGALDTLPLAYALWNLPRALAHLGHSDSALRLMAFAARLWTERIGPLSAADRRDEQRIRRLTQGRLDAAAREAAARQGRAMTLADAVALALNTPR